MSSNNLLRSFKMSSFNANTQKGTIFNLRSQSSIVDCSSKVTVGSALSLEVKRNHPIMQVDVTGTRIEFYEQENNVLVKAALDLDASLTPIESLRISALIQLVTAAAWSTPITYIRANNLERHFRFSVA